MKVRGSCHDQVVLKATGAKWDRPYRERWTDYAVACWWWVAIVTGCVSFYRGGDLLPSLLGAVISGVVFGSVVAAVLAAVRTPDLPSRAVWWQDIPRLKIYRARSDRRTKMALGTGIVLLFGASLLAPHPPDPTSMVCDRIEKALSEPLPSIAAAHMQTAVDERTELPPGGLRDVLQHYADLGSANPLDVVDQYSKYCA